MQYKFIRYDGSAFLIFPSTIKHIDMLSGNKIGKDRVTSAGFVGVHNGVWMLFGESMSIGVSSKPDDSEVFKKSVDPWANGKNS